MLVGHQTTSHLWVHEGERGLIDIHLVVMLLFILRLMQSVITEAPILVR